MEIQTSEITSEKRKGRALLSMEESGIYLIALGSEDERTVTLTHERMNSLTDLIGQVKALRPRGLIITGSGPEMFTAGADINLINQVSDPAHAEALARGGQDLFAEIEALPFPTVAAISGPCVGGGCELALACKYRVISTHRSSVIGLPEVKLGIIPGFGGTQRLPRLIGLPNALDIILSGKTLRPSQALRVGLVDAVASLEELRSKAEQFASRELTATRKSLPFKDRLLTHTALGRMLVRKQASKSIARETRGFYPAPSAALNSALVGLEQGTGVGYKYEAKELARLIVTSESKNLVRLFLLSESAKSLGKSARKAVEDLHSVVIGAGVMGAGIASALLKGECQVILKDTSEEALQRGLHQIKDYVAKLKYLSDTERSFILNRVETTTRESPNLGNAQFAIEAIFEELATKKKVLGDLARLLPQDAIIATNTSSLSITSIAEEIPHPERVIGMHFFNPVEKMPLIEIIRGKTTNMRAIALIAALSVKLGKFPIVVEDVPGFLINRILAPYISEAAHLLSDGYSIRDIDEVALAFGMPMGPVRLLDEVGLDVASHVGEIMVQGYGARMEAPPYAKKLSDIGRKGKKNGTGFYTFQGKEHAPWPDVRAVLGITTPEISNPDREEIRRRLFLRLINEATMCLDEGVAGAPGPEASGQIDLGSVMGFGFPPFRGGVLRYAETLGASKVLTDLRALEARYGMRFSPASGIIERAERGGSFLSRIAS